MPDDIKFPEGEDPAESHEPCEPEPAQIPTGTNPKTPPPHKPL